MNAKNYFMGLVSLIMSAAYANAQTADNSVDSSRIKVKETRKLETKIVKPGPKDSVYMAKEASYCEEKGITPLRKFSYSYFVLNELAIYLVTYKYDSETEKSYRHEWNHYKNYLFGAYLKRQTVEEAYLLAVLNEIISRVLRNAETPADLQFSLKQKLLSEFYEILDPYYDYKEDFLLSTLRFTVNSKEDTLKYKDQLKYSTQQIIDDMYIVYFGETKIDLKSYLSEKQRTKLTNTIMNNETSKQIIMITKAMLGYQQMTDSIGNVFIKNYPKSTKVLGL